MIQNISHLHCLACIIMNKLRAGMPEGSPFLFKGTGTHRKYSTMAAEDLQCGKADWGIDEAVWLPHIFPNVCN